MSTNFFSSLNGKFDLNSSMSSLYGDYNQIKSGAYSSLMKSYVKKVGNKSALKAYQEAPSMPEELATIPMLRREDIDKKAPEFIITDADFFKKLNSSVTG